MTPGRLLASPVSPHKGRTDWLLTPPPRHGGRPPEGCCCCCCCCCCVCVCVCVVCVVVCCSGSCWWRGSWFGPPCATLRGPTLCGPIRRQKMAEVEIGRSRNWPNSRPAHQPTTPTKRKKLTKFGQTKLTKFGQIRFGQMRPNKDGQIRFGQMRSRPSRGGQGGGGSPGRGGGEQILQQRAATCRGTSSSGAQILQQRIHVKIETFLRLCFQNGAINWGSHHSGSTGLVFQQLLGSGITRGDCCSLQRLSCRRQLPELAKFESTYNPPFDRVLLPPSPSTTCCCSLNGQLQGCFQQRDPLSLQELVDSFLQLLGDQSASWRSVLQNPRE